MHRSHILARELRGVVVVVLVGALIVWLFARLSNDRAEAQAAREAREATTTVVVTTTTSTTVAVNDNQRLCSLAAAFRADLREIPIVLVSVAGDPLPGDRPIDVGMHELGDITEEVQEPSTVAAAQAEASGASIPPTTAPITTTTEPPPTAIPPPSIINTGRIDPLESGLLGEPQRAALNFYTTASQLRLGQITADFAGIADHFATFVEIGEASRWDLEELEQSDLSDQWQALATRPPFGVDSTLQHIEETCSIRIGSGFVYREEAPALEVLPEIVVGTPIDPGAR